MASARRPRLDTAERQAMEALDLIMRIVGVNDQELAERLDVSRNWVGFRRTGGSRIRSGDHQLLADALRVPAELFRLDASEIHRWFADVGASWVARDSNPEPAGFRSLADAVA